MTLNDDSESGSRKLLRSYAKAGPFINVGFQFAAAIAIGLFGGLWIDEWLSTTPLFLILGILLGIASGFYSIYKATVDQSARNGEDE